MTDDALLAAGFKRFTTSVFDNCDELFQLRVRDSRGTRYFINVTRYDHPDHTGWQVDMTFNDGAKWHKPAAIQIKAYGGGHNGIVQWSPEDAIFWASEVWNRLEASYYEMEGAADA